MIIFIWEWYMIQCKIGNVGKIGNVEMDGYQEFHTASKSYVNKYFDSIERSDLNINSLEYTRGLKHKIKEVKNIEIASIYRHPHNNLELYIYGDFNFDLLKIDTDHYTQHFLTFFAVMEFYHIYFNRLEWQIIQLQ